jgi:hypothetical protein
MSSPFDRYTYVGLGLRVDGSVRCDSAGTWHATYLHEGEPYAMLEVRADGRTTLGEVDPDGDPVATTTARTLNETIGLHARDALDAPDGAPSRLWRRAASRAPWVWLAPRRDGLDFTSIPSMGIGRLRIPWPIDRDGVVPAPGPIARRISQESSFRPAVRRGALLRWSGDASDPEVDEIVVLDFQVVGAVLGELARDFTAANGGCRSIEWRRSLFPDLQPAHGTGWRVPAAYRAEQGSDLNAFGICWDVDAQPMAAGTLAVTVEQSLLPGMR